jgi:hypothetical protein
MVKYARIVFEEEISDNTSSEEALAILLKTMKNSPNYLSGEDVEISEYPYERME